MTLKILQLDAGRYAAPVLKQVDGGMEGGGGGRGDSDTFFSSSK